MVCDQRGGWRRVVPSPRPLDVIEKDVIARLVGNGDGRVVIAAGGGGIPVVRKGSRLVGVEAAIDKDLAPAGLARALRWKHLPNPPDEPPGALGFRHPPLRPLAPMCVAAAETGP